MTRPLQTSLALVLLFALLARADSFAHQKVKPRAQARSVTGTYKYVLNSLEVLELPDHQVRISFAGFWPNDRKRAETRNVGSFDETVPLKGQTAEVKLQYGADPCLLTVEFRLNKAIVTQEGSMMGCGFGFNVEADGAYTKVSRKPPSLSPH